MSLPRRPDLKRAWRAYVLGHDLGVAPEVKAAWGESSAAETDPRRDGGPSSGTPPSTDSRREASEARREAPEAVAADGAAPTPADGAAPTPADGAAPASADGAAPASAPGRVSVPERLDFHRGPDTWREREGG